MDAILQNGVFAPRSSHLLTEAAASVIGSALGAGTSIFGNAMNRKAMKEYNKGQMEIAQMNNEWNANEAAKNRDWQESMVNSQNQWNLEQWNRENEYNTASAQRQRLEAAGLNPYMMMNGGSAGSAGSVQSASPSGGSQASPAQMPNQQAMHYDFSGVANAVNSFFQNQKIAMDTKNANLDYNFWSSPNVVQARLGALVNGRFEYANPAYAQTRFAAGPNLAMNDMASLYQQTQALETNIALTSAQALATGLSAEYQEKVNNVFDINQSIHVATALGQLYSLFTQGKLNEARFKTEGVQQILLAAQASNEKLRYKQAEAIFDSAVEAMNARNGFEASYFKEKRKYVFQSVLNQASRDDYETEMRRIDQNYYEGMKRVQRELMDKYGDRITTGMISDILGSLTGFGSMLKPPSTVFNNRYNNTYYR